MLRRAIALVLIFAGDGALAQAIACGEPYAVRRGDTLMRIARRAYGGDEGLATLLAANRATLAGRDPSLIEVGEVLAIPCPTDATADAAPAVIATDSAAAPQRPTPIAEPPLAAAPDASPDAAPQVAAAVPPAAATGPTAEPTPRPRVVRLGGASGALAQPIVAAALSAALGADGFMIDAGEASGALRFAMVRPDCGAVTAPACAARWSAPLLEVALVSHTRADGVALADARACRSATAPGAGAAMQADAEGCLRAVAENRADIALAPAPEADAALAALPHEIAARLVERPGMATRVALRAMADPADADAVALLAALDAGLAALRARGDWFAVVQDALRAAE